MAQIIHPLLSLLASATRQELARQVAYLKEENRVLRARLPKRIVATDKEKRRLLRAGKKLGTRFKHECLNKFVIVAPRHLNYICRQWAIHYNRERPHEARDHLPPACEAPPEQIETLLARDVLCTTRLGGLLRSYERRAA